MNDILKLLFNLSIILLQVTVVFCWFNVFLYYSLHLYEFFNHTLDLHGAIYIDWLDFDFFFDDFSFCQLTL